MALRERRCENGRCRKMYRVTENDRHLMHGLEGLCSSCRSKKMREARKLADQHEKQLRAKIKSGEMFQHDISEKVERYYRKMIAR